MTDAAPHRTLDPPVSVLVDDNGGIWPAVALGWRGESVYVGYNSDAGMRHLLWLPASQVHRPGGGRQPPVTTRSRAPLISR